MGDGEALQQQLEHFFDGLPYQDPLEFGGVNLIGLRCRGRNAIDSVTGKYFSAYDSLSIYDASSTDCPVEVVSKRNVALAVGEFGRSQVVLNYCVDDGTMTVNGLGRARFNGDPWEEFKVGLRIIDKYESATPGSAD